MNIQLEVYSKQISFQNHNIDVRIIDKVYSNTDEVFARVFVCDLDDYLDEIIQSGVFSDFQKELVSKEYFSIRNDLRWNLYIVLLNKSDNNEVYNHQNYSDIIRDDEFARKLLLTQSEFDEFISSNFEFEDQTFEHDIVSKWYNTLESENLNGCLYNRNYRKSVEAFVVDNKSILPSGRVSTKSKTYKREDKYKVKKVNNISLFDYRKHCFGDIVKIELSDVNVFVGANGSGKTSTCDAIENAITGTNTNEGQVEIGYFNGEENRILKNDIANEERRKRDYNWYNSMTKKNKIPLESHFRSVNYLRSNIAKQSNDDMEVSSFLSSIIFGEEFGSIRDSVNSFRREFENCKKNYGNQIIETKSEIEKIKEVKIAPFEFTILEQLFENIGLMGYKANESNAIDDAIYTINDIKPEIQTFIAFMKDNKLNYASEIDTLEKSTTSQIANILKLQEHNKNVKLKIKKLGGNLQDLRTELDKVKARKSYYNDLSSKIVMYSDILSNTSVNAFVDAFEKLKNRTNLINLKLKNIKESIVNNNEFPNTTSSAELLNSKNENIRKRQDLDIKITDIASCLNDMETAIISIHSIIKKTDNNTHNCPLCGQDYFSYDALNKAIDKTLKTKKGIDKQYEVLLNEKNELVNEYAQIVKNNDFIDIINLTYKELKEKMINVDQWESLDNDKVKPTIKSKLEYIKLIIEKNNEDLIEITKNKYLYNLLIECKEDASNQFNTSDYNSKDFNKRIYDYYSKLDGKVITINNDIEINNSSIEELENISKDIDVNELNKHENIKYEIEINKKYLNTIIITFAEINYVDRTIIEIDSMFRKLNAQMDMYTRWKENSVVMKEHAERRSELSNTLEILNNRLHRCKRALDCFDSLENPEDILREFVQNNATFIEKIFRRIHQPKEFSDIEIKDDGEISFKRFNVNGNRVTQRNMSTGQAIALYTAVLLTLFKTSINAPNIIILDEPVANLDDLHLLSLIDIVRDFAIMGVQIIFTTANDDVAKILRRKFSFLNRSFREFRYVRYNAQPVIIRKYTYLPNREQAIVIE